MNTITKQTIAIITLIACAAAHAAENISLKEQEHRAMTYLESNQCLKFKQLFNTNTNTFDQLRAQIAFDKHQMFGITTALGMLAATYVSGNPSLANIVCSAVCSSAAAVPTAHYLGHQRAKKRVRDFVSLVNERCKKPRIPPHDHRSSIIDALLSPKISCEPTMLVLEYEAP